MRPGTELDQNIGRLMVRRYLRALVEQGIRTEEELITEFVGAMRRYPDEKLQQVAQRVERSVYPLSTEGVS